VVKNATIFDQSREVAREMPGRKHGSRNAQFFYAQILGNKM
jgi:hypothetical protein